MTTDPPEPKPRRKWHFYKWLVLLIVATFAYAQWRAYTFRSALKEAKALGWHVQYIEPSAMIRKNWRTAFKKQTWIDGVTKVAVSTGEQLEQHLDILRRLDPRELTIGDSPGLRDLSLLKGLTRLESLKLFRVLNLTNVDALKNLPTLKSAWLIHAASLTNVDGLKNLPELNSVVLQDCTWLMNVDALKTLPTLQDLSLRGCTALTNVDALKGLTALESIQLTNCTGLTNVDAIKGLTALQQVDLQKCTGLTKESIAALKAALPNTKFQTDWFPPLRKPNELDTPPGARDTDR